MKNKMKLGAYGLIAIVLVLLAIGLLVPEQKSPHGKAGQPLVSVKTCEAIQWQGGSCQELGREISTEKWMAKHGGSK